MDNVKKQNMPTSVLTDSTDGYGTDRGAQPWSIGFGSVILLVNKSLPGSIMKSKGNSSDHQMQSTNSMACLCLI